MENMIIDKEKFEVLAEKLYLQIMQDDYIKQNPIIIGILNGGKIIGDYLSDKLDLNVDYIKVSSRGVPNQQGKTSINKFIDISIGSHLLTNKPYLIVDDIVDSGLTIQIVKRLLPYSKSAVLLTKNRMLTDYYGMLLNNKNTWIDFYWENKT